MHDANFNMQNLACKRFYSGYLATSPQASRPSSQTLVRARPPRAAVLAGRCVLQPPKINYNTAMFHN